MLLLVLALNLLTGGVVGVEAREAGAQGAAFARRTQLAPLQRVTRRLSQTSPELTLYSACSIAGFRRAFNYTFSRPESLLGEAVRIHWGDVRMRRFVAKWLSGQQVTIGLVGGDVSAVQRSSDYSQQYFARVQSFLAGAFPGARVIALNNALSQSTVRYPLLCTDTAIPPQVDLLLVEVLLAEPYDRLSPRASSSTRFIQQLLKKVLARSSRMAVLPIYLTKYKRNPTGPDLQPYEQSMETMWRLMADYYQVSGITMRNLLFLRMRQNATGFSPQELLQDGAQVPSRAGHALIGDAVVLLLRNVMCDLAMTAAPGPVNLTGVAALPVGPVPFDMMSFVTAPEELKCTLGDALQSAKVSSLGFAWQTLAGVNASGWLASAANASLVLRVPVTRTPAVANTTMWSTRVTLFLGYVPGLDKMAASVTCLAGCSCTRKTVNGTTLADGTRPSTPVVPPYALANLTMTAAVNATSCQVVIKVLPPHAPGLLNFMVNFVGTVVLPVQSYDRTLATL